VFFKNDPVSACSGTSRCAYCGQACFNGTEIQAAAECVSWLSCGVGWSVRMEPDELCDWVQNTYPSKGGDINLTLGGIDLNNSGR
jgi:hypothetical protein